MSEENNFTAPVESTESATVETTRSLSDEQVDKFFESGGDSDAIDNFEPDHSIDEPTPTEEKPVKIEEDKADVIERNYKAAMHEERQKRQELQKTLSEYQEHMAKLERQQQEIMQRAKTSEVPEKAPNYEEDPIGYLKWENQQLANKMEAHNRYLQDQHQKQQQQAAYQEEVNKTTQFLTAYSNSAKEYMKEVPDFKDAYHFIEKSRIEEYMAAGHSHEVASQLLIEDEMAIASRAFMDGVKPAARLMEIAKLRGWKPKGAAESAPSKLESISKGIKSSKSLGTAGHTEGGKLTPSDVDHMNDKEFDNLWDQIAGKGRR
jgi:hypothetical protein